MQEKRLDMEGGHPGGEASYRFTKDYTTAYVPLWNAHVGAFRGKPDVHFLEVGTFEGRTALWFLDNILTHPSSSMTCVDFFEDTGYEPRFDHNRSVSGHAGRWSKLKGRSNDVLRVPMGAVFRRGDGWATYRVDGGRARLVEVDLGRRGETMVEVASGLTEGAAVAVHPGDRVKDGARVEPR